MMYQDVVRSRRSVRDFMPDVEIPKEELMAMRKRCSRQIVPI